MNPEEAAEFATSEGDATAEAVAGDDGGGDAPGIGRGDILDALLNDTPNPDLEKLPGSEPVSYFLRGTLKMASDLLGKSMDVDSLSDTAVHDYVRAFVAAREQSGEISTEAAQPAGGESIE
ncbi:hypothetical protein BRC81_00220 [Halobacteriales archaeon QS_1_68_20]|nr:MAG: hypothetical protein BRC81_00220 [Halobacteriales archaeon QS_1_68_20]